MSKTQSQSFKNNFSPARGKVYDSFLDTIGGTPLVALPQLSKKENLHAKLLLKLEFFNPLGSVKDRIGLAMIRDAEEKNIIHPQKTIIVEPTSGNTGISLAFAAASLGYKLIVTMPENASIERQKMLRLMGAQIELTPHEEGMGGSIKHAQNIVKTLKHAWMPSQFNNNSNPLIHASTTAEEIWQDTKGKVDYVIAGLGTGGTATGIATRLKNYNPNVKVFGIEPKESAFLQGERPGSHNIQGIGPGFKPKTLNLDLIDKIYSVSEEEALHTARYCARTEGLPIGISSGAALHLGLTLAKQKENKDKIIVAIIPSFAERYLSTSLFEGI